MFNDIKEGSIILLRALIKGVTGFIILPIGILVNAVKSGFEEASLPVKIFTGILLLPMTGFLLLTARWWQDFDIVD